MSILNIEFKAKTNKLTEQENLFLKQRPLFIGEDHQVDTYFNVAVGRLKLREGNIENALIHYEREDFAVKFHFDTVEGLGTFVEVEAIDKDGSIGKEKLQAQCDAYAALLGITAEDFCSVSYSDMILSNHKEH